MSLVRCVAPACTIAVLAAACSAASTPDRIKDVTVFAAASLTEAFAELGTAYERRNRGVVVRFNFLSSSDLAAQIEQGAPADVFASADEASMQRIVDDELVDSNPQIFAHNKLAIVVASDNPGNVRSLADLATEELVTAICVETCPAGRYAREVFERAGIAVQPDSLEPDVRAVITRVEVGEADAGIVYETDVLAAGDDVAGIDIPEADNSIATYLIATLRGAEDGARDFVSFVLSGAGQKILVRHGFLPR